MPNLPPTLPEKGKLRALFRWLNQLRAYVYSQRPLQSHNVLTEATGSGTFRQGLPTGKAGSGNLQFRGQWLSSESYVEDDLVYCDTSTERDTGTQAGLYLCIDAVSGSTHPSADGTHWELYARGHWDKLTFRSGTKSVLVDCTATKGLLKLWNTSTPTDGSVTIDLNDVPVGAGDKEIKIRETEGRDESDGSCKVSLILRSEWY